MENKIQINPIGKVKAARGEFAIILNDSMKQGLANLDGYSHIQVIWWGHLHDDSKNRNWLLIDKPYKKGPDKVGVFATRSEMRPNPILITTVPVSHIDFEKGIIHLYYIDAVDDTMVLDIKPYHKTERVKECRTPQWCSHWPQWYEEAGNFDWQNEFNF
jgi:tRNA-Thr(GGU) m(6)t(6)A37 methyltransferase TsaA